MPYKDPEKRRQHDRRRRDRSEYEARPEVLERRRQYSAKRRKNAGAGEKAREASRQYWERMTPDERWAVWLRRRHGMYPAHWHAMWTEQDGKCYLCLAPLPEDRSKVALDHDHSHCRDGYSCGLCRRGLACSTCNTAIGLLGDSTERMRIAADNLERAQAIVQSLISSAAQQQHLF